MLTWSSGLDRELGSPAAANHKGALCGSKEKIERVAF